MIDQYGIMNNMENKKKSLRASIPQSALKRILFIDKEIASGKFPNTGYLAKKWEGKSIATIYRDIDFMKVWMNAPIEYSALHRGYYYSEPNYRIPMGFSGADELLTLGMAKNILAMYKDTPIHDAAQRLLDSITAPVSAAVILAFSTGRRSKNHRNRRRRYYHIYEFSI